MPFDGPIMIGSAVAVVILGVAFGVRTYVRIKRKLEAKYENQNPSA